MCDLFHCKRSDLIEEKNTDFPTALSPKDERDIAKDLDRIMGEIQKGDRLYPFWVFLIRYTSYILK